MAPADGEREAPTAAQLAALTPDAWSVVLRHARAVLAAMEEATLDARLKRLRAAPPSKLVGGRMRDELCRAIAQDGVLWRELSGRLDEDPDAADIDWAADRPAAPKTTPTRAKTPAPADDDRLRERVRALRDEVDVARRRAVGAEARVRALEADLAASTARGDALAAERETLDRALVAAADERREALARAQRGHERELTREREENRRLRRELEERERDRRRDERARAGIDAAAREEVSSYRTSRRTAAAGSSSGALKAGRAVLVDGYNVTKRQMEHLPLEQQRQWLVRLLEALAARRGVHPTVVFDGTEDGGRAPRARGVHVRFSAGEKADDTIVRIVDERGDAAPLVVVTDDRELRQRLPPDRTVLMGVVEFLVQAQ